MGMIYGTMRDLPQMTTSRGQRRTCNKPLTVKSKRWIKRTIAKYERRMGLVEIADQLDDMATPLDLVDVMSMSYEPAVLYEDYDDEDPEPFFDVAEFLDYDDDLYADVEDDEIADLFDDPAFHSDDIVLAQLGQDRDFRYGI